MNSQLICCDHIEFNKEKACHMLGRVINRIELSTRPKVIDLDIFIKLSGIDPDKSYELELQLKDSDKKIRAYTEKFIVYNRRQPEQVPGVDSSSKMKAIITKPGNYTVELWVDGVNTASYPVYIYDQGNISAKQ